MDYPGILSAMLRSRFFERSLEDMFEHGMLYGTTHLSIGQEASHTGLCKALEKGDWVVPTHRCHGYNIAMGTSLEAMYGEMLGSRHGICKGIGGSMHMTDVSVGNLGSSAIVGSGITLAAGAAFALKRQKRNSIAVAVFGDGATSRGSLHEIMNLASVWSLPLLFFLENNHYGMSASAERMISTDRIYRRAAGYSIDSELVDGNDAIAVLTAVQNARERILREQRPYFIEVDTYRLCGHSKSDRCVYRSRSEEDEWREKDPIRRYCSYLISSGILGEEGILSIADSARRECSSALERALRKKDEVLGIEELEELVYAPSFPVSCNHGSVHHATYREAIREALAEILESDPRACIIGEDIGAYGGCFGVTGDLYRRFPDSVYETPVSEEGFVGLAAGAAMLSEHPIAEVMYGDFTTLASDALINHAAKSYFMSAGQLSCPMVFRTAMGGGTGHGCQHSQCPETMLLGVPGLIIVAPSTPYRAKALLKSANRANNPVVFLEHKALYPTEGDVGDEDAFLPIGKAFVDGCGRKLLAISYSMSYARTRRALESIAHDVTFLDLSTLQPLDEESIRSLSSEIGRVLIVEDTPLQGSVAESVVRIIETHCDADIRIVSAASMPVPFSRRLESYVLPCDEAILSAANELLCR